MIIPQSEDGLNHILATVGRDGRTIDETCLFRRKEDHDFRDLLWRAHTGHRDLTHDRIQYVLLHCGGHIRFNIARTDRIDRNPLGGTFQCQGLCEPQNTGLCGGIIGLAKLTLLTID